MPTSAAANPGNKENASRSSSTGGGSGAGNNEDRATRARASDAPSGAPRPAGGGYSGPKGFIGPSDAGLKAAGMPASSGGWTGTDTERDALKKGVSIAGAVLGALVGFPGGGFLGKLVPDRTTAERYADTHGYPGGGFGGPGKAGQMGGGNTDNPMAQRLTAMARAAAAGVGGDQQAASPAPAPAPGATPMLSPGAVPAATNPFTYGETGPEKVFFPQSSQILTDLAQRIQKLTAKDMTGVDKIDPLTGLPMKPGAVPRATSPINRQMFPLA